MNTASTTSAAPPDAPASTASTLRKRLNQQPRGSAVGPGGRGTVVFGGVILAAGALMILVGLGVVIPKESSGDAPPWVLTVMGVVFGLIGLTVAVLGVRGLRNRRRFREQRGLHPDEPWLADYPWDPKQSVDNTVARILRTSAMATFLVLFLTPFNAGVFFYKDAPWFIQGVILLFDVVVLAVLGSAVYLLLRWLKYGPSFVRFSRFPFFLGQTLEVEWCSPRGIGACENLTFTLRCVEEVLETTGSGRDRSQSLVPYQVWSDTFEVAGPGEHLRGERVPVTFLLPESAEATALSQYPPRYWELEIKARTPGVDYGAVYLLPVYSGGNDARASAAA
jgi:hypothetical protein